MRTAAILLTASFASVALAAPPAFSPADTRAIHIAAGFKPHGNGYADCAAADPSWPRSSIFVEAVDLNGDGKPEAILSEGNVACYGRDEQGFTILTRQGVGWRKIASGTGVAAPMKTRAKGWADVEVGGPGSDRKPVMRWTGAAYGDPR